MNPQSTVELPVKIIPGVKRDDIKVVVSIPKVQKSNVSVGSLTREIAVLQTLLSQKQALLAQVTASVANVQIPVSVTDEVIKL